MEKTRIELNLNMTDSEIESLLTEIEWFRETYDYGFNNIFMLFDKLEMAVQEKSNPKE